MHFTVSAGKDMDLCPKTKPASHTSVAPPGCVHHLHTPLTEPLHHWLMMLLAVSTQNLPQCTCLILKCLCTFAIDDDGPPLWARFITVQFICIQFFLNEHCQTSTEIIKPQQTLLNLNETIIKPQQTSSSVSMSVAKTQWTSVKLNSFWWNQGNSSQTSVSFVETWWTSSGLSQTQHFWWNWGDRRMCDVCWCPLIFLILNEVEWGLYINPRSQDIENTINKHCQGSVTVICSEEMAEIQGAMRLPDSGLYLSFPISPPQQTFCWEWTLILLIKSKQAEISENKWK